MDFVSITVVAAIAILISIGSSVHRSVSRVSNPEPVSSWPWIWSALKALPILSILPIAILLIFMWVTRNERLGEWSIWVFTAEEMLEQVIQEFSYSYLAHSL